MLVLCGARIGGLCGLPQCLGPAPFQGSTSLGSSIVTTPFNPGNVAAGSSSVGSLITPYVRGVFRGGWVGGWEGWLCGDCECYRVRGGLGLGYNLQ